MKKVVEVLLGRKKDIDIKHFENDDDAYIFRNQMNEKAYQDGEKQRYFVMPMK